MNKMFCFPSQQILGHQSIVPCATFPFCVSHKEIPAHTRHSANVPPCRLSLVQLLRSLDLAGLAPPGGADITWASGHTCPFLSCVTENSRNVKQKSAMLSHLYMYIHVFLWSYLPNKTLPVTSLQSRKMNGTSVYDKMPNYYASIPQRSCKFGSRPPQ